MHSSHSFEDALSQLLSSIGEDPTRPGLRDTPVRVKEWYEEFFSRIKNQGFNADGDNRIKIADDDLPVKPKTKHKVVY